jgi:hypothetical protein
MAFDIRLPIGMLFSVLGVFLIAYGALSEKTIYQRSSDINLNLWWGLIILVFGLIMFALGRRGARREPSWPP